MNFLEMKKYLTKRNILFFSIFILFVIIPVFFDTPYRLHLFINGLLFISIIIFLFNKEKKYLFEPIYIFSLYYLTVPIVIWYYIITDFQNNKFVGSVSYSYDFNMLFLISVFYFAIGYILCVIGYKKCKSKREEKECKIILESKEKISNFSCNLVSFLFIGVGIINFLYNVFYYANGNIFHYLISIANRSSEFSNGGTTLGYTIATVGIFILLFKTLRDRTRKSYIFFLFSFIVVFIMKLSTGRIFSTISFLGVVTAVYYFYLISKTGKFNNRIFLWCGGGFLLLGIIIYFIRIVGGLEAAGQLNGSVFSYFKNFIDQIGYYAIDKGNMPNIALMPKIIDSWSNDIGYLYGSSIFSSLFTFLPSSITPHLAIPAVIIKEAWFTTVPSGNLPITLIGEFFVNFGWIGPIIGMFIFGYLITQLFKYTLKKNNYWIYVIAMQITIGFIALSPKGEVNNFSMWMVLPYILSYLFLIFITKLENKYSNKIQNVFHKINSKKGK